MLQNVQILSSATYIPSKRVVASEIDQKIHVKPGTCLEKTGVAERFFVDLEAGESAAEMGAKAGQAALDRAGLRFDQIDALICASNARDQPMPGMGPRYHKFLCGGRASVPTFDINSTCLSFVTALDTCSYMLHAGRYRRVLIISSEIASIGVDWTDLESAALFGDGAVAVVVAHSNDHSSGVIAANMETYSDYYDYCEAPAGGILNPPWNYSAETDHLYKFKMDGRKLFRAVSATADAFFYGLLKQAEVSLDDIKMVIPHQASLSSLVIMRRKLGIPEEKFYINVHRRGNLVAASIPTCLHETIEQQLIKRGDLVMLVGTSAGVSLGGLIMRY